MKGNFLVLFVCWGGFPNGKVGGKKLNMQILGLVSCYCSIYFCAWETIFGK